jgi:hypothetical protein
VELSTHQFEVLKVAHKFQLELMTRSLGHEVPVPETITRVLSSPLTDLSPDDLRTFRNWRDVLDLGISPLMVRDTLKEIGNWTMAESLLSHHVWKRSPSEPDRDKTDFLATHMFRNPPNPGDWDINPPQSDAAPPPTSPFELALRKILGPSTEISLTPNHRQLVAEFDYFRQDVEDFRHFDQMMDSGLIKRVREVKESLGLSIYHPHVLAVLASFNTCFGQRFDELFYAAARSIKSFAEKVQQDGGSTMSRVDGDVTVNQLASVEETKILQTEYLKARDQFHSVSRFKKAVDNRRGRERPAATAPHHSPNAAPQGNPSAPPQSPDFLMAIEESKLTAMQESIANLVKDLKPAVTGTVVRVRHVNVGLLPTETEAYRSKLSNEKSYRADVARLLAKIVALIARISGELTDYRSKQSSAYLWKPHADSLACLLNISQPTLQHAQELHNLASQRGLTEKASAIDASVQRLREHVQVIAATLDQLPQRRNST